MKWLEIKKRRWCDTNANRGKKENADRKRRKNEYRIIEEKKEAWHNWRVLMGQNTGPLYETSCTRIQKGWRQGYANHANKQINKVKKKHKTTKVRNRQTSASVLCIICFVSFTFLLWLFMPIFCPFLQFYNGSLHDNYGWHVRSRDVFSSVGVKGHFFNFLIYLPFVCC